MSNTSKNCTLSEIEHIFNFKHTPFEHSKFEFGEPSDAIKADHCAMCKKKLEDDNHKTSCCAKRCHKWCDEQCHEYLFKCPLCKDLKDYCQVKFMFDFDNYFSATKKARFFSTLYNDMYKNKLCVCIPRIGDLDARIPREEYKYFVELINNENL